MYEDGNIFLNLSGEQDKSSQIKINNAPTVLLLKQCKRKRVRLQYINVKCNIHDYVSMCDHNAVWSIK